MANETIAGEELLLDVRVAEASKAYKFYLNQERKILGTISVALSYADRPPRMEQTVQFLAPACYGSLDAAPVPSNSAPETG